MGDKGATTGGPDSATGSNGWFAACPIDTAFGAFGKKWSILILHNLLKGHRHFNELLAHVEGINPKMLSARLKELEHEFLIAKRVVGTSPVRIEYDLTDKGRAILPVLRSLAAWSVQWAPDRVFEGGRRPATIAECIRAWEADLQKAAADGFLSVEPEPQTTPTTRRPRRGGA